MNDKLLQTVTQMANPVARGGSTPPSAREEDDLLDYLRVTKISSLPEKLKADLSLKCVVALMKRQENAIDVKGLGESFLTMTAALRTNLTLNEELKKEYKASQKDGKKTREAMRKMKWMLAGTMVAVGLSAGVSYRASVRTYEAATESKELLSDALYAMNLSQAAQIARVEAEATLDIEAVREAEVKQVEAEIAVVKAQSKSAPTEQEKVHADRKLPKLRAKKARMIRMKAAVEKSAD